MEKKSLYDVLGVSKEATQKEIRKAYIQLSKEHHPDKGGNEEKFKEINAAHEILSDVSRRKIYDETGATEKFSPEVKKTFFQSVYQELILPNVQKQPFVTKDDIVGMLFKALQDAKKIVAQDKNKLKNVKNFQKRMKKSNKNQDPWLLDSLEESIMDLKMKVFHLEYQMELMSELKKYIAEGYEFQYITDEEDNPQKMLMTWKR